RLADLASFRDERCCWIAFAVSVWIGIVCKVRLTVLGPIGCDGLDRANHLVLAQPISLRCALPSSRDQKSNQRDARIGAVPAARKRLLLRSRPLPVTSVHRIPLALVLAICAVSTGAV